MSKAKLAIALGTLIVASIAGAVPILGTAPFHLQRKQTTNIGLRTAGSIVAPIRFRDDHDGGLLVTGWINSAGPFVFAIDTGAGVSLLSQSVISRAGLLVSSSKQTLVGGLSTSTITSNQESRVSKLALGSADNLLPATFVAAVVPRLPGTIDGVLDPTEAFSPFGYSIDLPNRELLAFDATTHGLRISEIPEGGTVVRWVRESGSHRPYVRLGDGRLALIDTGSGFGLAINESRVEGNGLNHRRPPPAVRDLGGGSVQVRQVAPVTVNIGDLVLRGVPTDVLLGAARGTPLILGRRALYPFRITFDPVAQLIAIQPSERH